MKMKYFHYFASLLLIINHCNGSNYRIQQQDHPDVNDKYGGQNHVKQQSEPAFHSDRIGGHGTYSDNPSQEEHTTQRHSGSDDTQQSSTSRGYFDISSQNTWNQDQGNSANQQLSTVSDEHVPGKQTYSEHDDYDLSHEVRYKIQTPPQNKTVTIAVLGRSGSGVSSTIRELIGSKSNCLQPNGTETFQNLLEYTITNIPSTVDGQFYKLRLVDVPGFVDGRSTEDESKILASLKSYSQSKGDPDFYLALSRFDDNRIDGAHSLFVQFLKRVELYQNVFLNNTSNANVNGSNIVFLLTRLMSETKLNQRRPQDKMGEFVRIIETFTNLQTPHTIVVGDNNAESEYDAKVEGGYYKLPNRQHYPKNIWQALINSTADPDIANLLTSVMNNRETEMQCEVKLISTEWTYYHDDVDAFAYLLSITNTKVEENEINARIEDAFERKYETRTYEIVQKIALQLRLQHDNITLRQDLPNTLPDRASFFRRSKQVSAFIPAQLLNEAFKLKMPEYIPQLTVGYGYVVMSDEISTLTPFSTDIYEPSSVGYQFPNFMKCRKLFSPETQYFKSYSISMSEYIAERLKYLDFTGKDNITEQNFKGKVKEGFNLKPEEGENVATLTAINEQRTLTCNLVTDKSQWVLNAEFIEEVDSLTAFNEHDRESVNEWNSWFEKWGSHIVTQGYGGGRIHGSIVGASVKKILESRSKIDETLNAILKYTPLPFNDSGTPAYRLYGGESESKSENLYSLEDEERNNVIKNWEATLGSNFKMLTNEFRLEPISTIVKAQLGFEKGDLIENAIGLLLNGNLKYTRKRKSKPSGGTGNNDGNRNNGGKGSRMNSNNNRNTSHDSRVPVDATPAKNNPARQLDTIRPTSTSSRQPNPNPGDLSSFNSTVFEGQAVLQVQINNTNQLIERVENDLKQKKERDERQHQEELARFERQKEEQKRKAKEKSEEMRRKQAQASQNRLASYQAHFNSLNDIQRKEEQHYNDMISELKRKDAEAEIAHKKLMAQLEKKQKEEDKETRKCTGWDMISPKCFIG